MHQFGRPPENNPTMDKSLNQQQLKNFYRVQNILTRSAADTNEKQNFTLWYILSWTQCNT